MPAIRLPRTAQEPPRDAGMGLVGGLITITLVASTALAGASAYRAVIANTHQVAGAANVYTIAQAAQADAVVHGTDLHDALLSAAASCACGVSVQSSGSVLVYRTGDRLVEFDMDTGQTTQAPATGSDTQPDISQGDGIPHAVLVDLGPSGG